jgi:hypothetical protein
MSGAASPWDTHGLFGFADLWCHILLAFDH